MTTVFQDYALFPHMSVRRQRRLRPAGAGGRPGASAASGPPRRWRRCALSGTEKRSPTQLSGGQRQRVALARALVVDPQVLLLDEPLGALDLKLREQMQVELKQIQREVGITFVFVTHDQEEALTMSDRIAVFNNGRVEQVGPAAEVYERPGTAVRRRLRRHLEPVDGRGRAGSCSAGPAPSAVRPEKMRLHRDGSTPGRPTCRAPGTVAEVVYAGSLTRYLVDLDAGARLVVAVQNQDRTSSTRSGARHPRGRGLSTRRAAASPSHRTAPGNATNRGVSMRWSMRSSRTTTIAAVAVAVAAPRSAAAQARAAAAATRQAHRGFTPPDVPMQKTVGKGEGEVNILAWPGYAEDGSTDPTVDWVTPFEKQTGCKVNVKTSAPPTRRSA